MLYILIIYAISFLLIYVFICCDRKCKWGFIKFKRAKNMNLLKCVVIISAPLVAISLICMFLEKEGI